MLTSETIRGVIWNIDVLQDGPSCGVAADHPVALALAVTVEAVTGKRPAYESNQAKLSTMSGTFRIGVTAFAFTAVFFRIRAAAYAPCRGR